MNNRIALSLFVIAAFACAKNENGVGTGTGGPPVTPLPDASVADAGTPLVDAGNPAVVDAGSPDAGTPVNSACNWPTPGLGNNCAAATASSCGNSCLTCMPLDGGACHEACNPSATTFACHGATDACLPAAAANNQISATVGGCASWTGCATPPTDLGALCANGACASACLTCIPVRELDADAGTYSEKPRCLEKCNMASAACHTSGGQTPECVQLTFTSQGTPAGVPGPRAGVCATAPGGTAPAYGGCKGNATTPAQSCAPTAGQCVGVLQGSAACAPTCKGVACPAYPATDGGASVASCVNVVFSNARTCTSNAQCGPEEACSQGKCVRPSCLKLCASNDECALGTTCVQAPGSQNKFCMGQ